MFYDEQGRVKPVSQPTSTWREHLRNVRKNVFATSAEIHGGYSFIDVR